MEILSKKQKHLDEYNKRYSKELAFDSRSSVIHRFGNELIKDCQTAVSELVKNSFDADATRVDILFHNLNKDNAKIVIRDDGTGMSKDDIEKKWMLLSTEDKIKEARSPFFGRVRLGAKGIGRFAVDKLGTKLTLVTKKESDPYSLRVKFDWKDFDKTDTNLGDIKMPTEFLEPEPGFHQGTKLIIKGLRDNWTKNKTSSIFNELSQLLDPEERDKNFEISVESDDWADLNGKLSNPLTGKETHRIDFEIDAKGNYKKVILVEGALDKKVSIKRNPLLCGPIRANIRYYAKGVKTSEAKLSRTRTGEKAETHLGIKIIRDKFRVRPYGEMNDDWLEIKARRSTAGGKFPIKYNYISGTVYISKDENPELKDSTDRESIIVNDQFLEMRKFIMEHLDLLSDILREEENIEQRKKRKEHLEKVLNYCSLGLQKQHSDEYKETIDKLDKSRKGDVDISIEKKERPIRKVGEIKNEIWECLVCGDRWKVPIGKTPTKCREFSVRTDGTYIDKPGCGSTRVVKYERPEREEKRISRPGGRREDQVDIISGVYAIVSGKMLTPRIDYDMREEDEEVEFRELERQIAVNPYHISFKVAEIFDKKSEGSYFQIGEEKLSPALSIHVIKCICISWAKFHAEKTGKIAEFARRYNELKDDIYGLIRSDIEVSSRYVA